MDGFRIIIICGVLLYLAFKAIKIIYNRYEIKNCTGVAEGHFVYANGTISSRQPVYYPVYEYWVNDRVYLVEYDKMFVTPSSHQSNVEIKYDPRCPQICFIEDRRGRIMSKVD